MDFQDGELAVQVDGTVDTQTAGLYELIYTATDNDGNSVSGSREVIVGNLAYLIPESTWGFANEEVIIPFKVSGFTKISGLQFSLEWDPSVMTIVQSESNGSMMVKVTQSATIPMGDIDFPMIMGNNLSLQGPGKLSMLWDEALQPDLGRTLDDDSVLFALHFTLAETPDLETNLTLVDDPTPFKMAPSNGGDIPEYTKQATIAIGNKVPPEITLRGLATVVHEAATGF